MAPEQNPENNTRTKQKAEHYQNSAEPGLYLACAPPEAKTPYIPTYERSVILFKTENLIK